MHPACTLTLHSANTWLPNPLCFLYVCSHKDLMDANTTVMFGVKMFLYFHFSCQKWCVFKRYLWLRPLYC